MNVFHEGELAVQQRAGVADQAATLGPRMVRPRLDRDFANFLAAQPFIVLASVSGEQVWASPLAGPPGFARATAPDRIRVSAPIRDEDPLAAPLSGGPTPVGMLVMDPMSRGRIRLNGLAERTDHGLELSLRECFGNCPKYIQRRYPTEVLHPETVRPPTTSGAVNPDQRSLMERADTFFLASRHPERGADCSHRGGQPGFVVTSADGRTIAFPDYQGNNMFQTLGNLTVDPAAGLLFIDWPTGRTVQLTGRATILWDDARLAQWPGALRMVEVTVTQVVDRADGMPYGWEFVEAHRLNPAAPARSAAE